jgi:hypothetical protein
MSAFPRVALLDLEDAEVAVRYAGDPAWEDPDGFRFPPHVCVAFDAVASGELAIYALPGDPRTVARIRIRVRFG